MRFREELLWVVLVSRSDSFLASSKCVYTVSFPIVYILILCPPETSRKSEQEGTILREFSGQPSHSTEEKCFDQSHTGS